MHTVLTTLWRIADMRLAHALVLILGWATACQFSDNRPIVIVTLVFQ